jgi:excisionase family DNA binding protein
MVTMEDTIFTGEELAQKLRINPRSIPRLIKERGLKAFKVGIEYRIRARDLDEFIDQEIKAQQQKEEN